MGCALRTLDHNGVGWSHPRYCEKPIEANRKIALSTAPFASDEIDKNAHVLEVTDLGRLEFDSKFPL